MSIGSIATAVNDLMPFDYGLVVITGGEPFRQNISPLCQSLLFNLGYVVQVETNGTLPPSEGLPARVVIVCSPKAGKINHMIAARADCYKYVLSHTSIALDGLPSLVLGHNATPHVARPPEGYAGKVYLQPMDSQDSAENAHNVQAVVSSCMSYGYILQLQIHKLINLE